MKNRSHQFVLVFVIILFSFSCEEEIQMKPDNHLLNNELVLSSFIDNRDGTQYSCIKYGEKYWMIENLKYLPVVNNPDAINLSNESLYAVYGYEGDNVDEAKSNKTEIKELLINAYESFGVYYNWTSAQTCCPNGWHLPTNDDWEDLRDYLINNGFNYDSTYTENMIGQSMAVSDDGWWPEMYPVDGKYNYSENLYWDYGRYWASSRTEGDVGNAPNNSSLFSAVPAGLYKANMGKYMDIRNISMWWGNDLTSTFSSIGALSSSSAKLYITPIDNSTPPDDAYTVRCVKD